MLDRNYTYLTSSTSPVSTPDLKRLRSPKPWLLLGSDDNFFETLYNLSLSPTHASVLQKKLSFTLGRVEYDHAWSRVLEIPVAQFVETILKDYFVYNTFAFFVDLEPHRSVVDGVVRTHYDITGIRPVSPRQVRRATPIDTSLQTTSYYYSWDFANYGQPENKPVEYDRFDPECVGAMCDMDDIPITTLYYYEGNIAPPNMYPLPTYIGALVDILADQSASNFRYKALSSGFSVVATLKIPNEALTDAERIETESLLRRRYVGDNGEPLMFLYGVPSSNGEIVYPELEYQPLPDISAVYSEVSRDALFKILLAHQIPPVLAGFTENGGIASEGAAIASAARLFEVTYARQVRDTIISALNTVFPNPIRIEPLDLSELL